MKVISPFGSISAHGRFGGVVYQTGRTGQIVRAHVPQRGIPSARQLQQNYLFGLAADGWRVLSDEDKEVWENNAKGKKMSGFNYYIKMNMKKGKDVFYGRAKYGYGKYV